MIKNLKQYSITKKKCEEFRNSLSDLEKRESPNLMEQIMKNAIVSQIETFEKELKEYDKLRENNIRVLPTKIENLPVLLIKARIVQGMTQKELAIRCQLREQQIQRYEDEEYNTASFNRIMKIANCLSIGFEPFKAIINDEPLEVEGYDKQVLIDATKRLQLNRSLFVFN